MKRKAYIEPIMEVIEMDVTALQSASLYLLLGGDDGGVGTPIFVE